VLPSSCWFSKKENRLRGDKEKGLSSEAPPNNFYFHSFCLEEAVTIRILVVEKGGWNLYSNLQTLEYKRV
jgi:hypothetical protein